MARKPPKTEPEARAELAVSRDEADAQIGLRIVSGEDIAAKTITSPDILKVVEEEYFRWDSYNAEMLDRLFTTDKFAREYSFFGIAFINTYPSFPKDLQDFKERMQSKLHRLASIRGRLSLIPQGIKFLPVPGASPSQESNVAQGRRIFIVHGHDTGTRESVARFLERLSLEVIILQEQAGRSRTLVEKLEDHSDVDFAIILLTGDDVGAAKGDQANLKPRARQNVILELGYFVAKLRRNNVCALYAEGVELPSDFVGVQYVQIRSGWEFEVAKELKAAGFDIDTNKLL
jgi:hypothetical protein